MGTDRTDQQERLLLTQLTVDRWPDPVLWIEQSGRIAYANVEASDTLGYTREELQSARIMDLDPAFSEEELPGRWEELARKGSRVFESRLRSAGGTLIPFEVRASHIRHGDREFDVCILKDLSQRREALERFQEMAELLPVVVFEADPDLTLTYMNRKGFELFGYSRKDFEEGLDGYELFAPDDRRRARAVMARQVRGKALGAWEYSARRKDGSTFPVLFQAGPIFRQGELSGIRGVFADLSERKQLEDQLRRAQKMESIGRLSGGVAHDLNNLLSPVLGYGEMLLAEFGPEDERREAVVEIVRAAERARDLVRQLLAFGRRQTLEFKPLDLNVLLEDFEKLLRRTIRENITLEIDLSPALPTILADRGQVEQVVMNLAVNAQEAMPAGGAMSIRTGAVELGDAFVESHRGARPGMHVLLAVADTGRGMDAETAEKVFEPFFTTKPTGTGLGMATVYGIVKQHGGSIWVESEPERGTTVTCYFPVVDTPEDSPRPSGSGESRVRGSETVMVVEDEPAVLRLTVTALERQGYRVLAATDGRECLEILRRHSGPLDLVLSDVVLPGVDGHTLFRNVKDLFPDARVLFMSGYSPEVITHHGAGEPDTDLIHKPFSIRYLTQKVREVLADR